MKLDPLFTIKNNRLYRIADDKETDLNAIKRIELPWSILELEPENYNEEYLAKLRDDLKDMEEKEEFAVIVPVADRTIGEPESGNDEEAFIAAYNHAARRIKDCVSVIGFEIPEEIENQSDFIDILSKKHGHYIYFTKANNTMPDRIISY